MPFLQKRKQTALRQLAFQCLPLFDDGGIGGSFAADAARQDDIDVVVLKHGPQFPSLDERRRRHWKASATSQSSFVGRSGVTTRKRPRGP